MGRKGGGGRGAALGPLHSRGRIAELRRPKGKSENIYIYIYGLLLVCIVFNNVVFPDAFGPVSNICLFKLYVLLIVFSLFGG